jgi:hypothetical protein
MIVRHGKAITSALRLLTDRPDVQDDIRAEPERLPAFVEEVLRYEPPVRGIFRIATRDTEIGGVPVPEGSFVQLMWAIPADTPNADLAGRSPAGEDHAEPRPTTGRRTRAGGGSTPPMNGTSVRPFPARTASGSEGPLAGAARLPALRGDERPGISRRFLERDPARRRRAR